MLDLVIRKARLLSSRDGALVADLTERYKLGGHVVIGPSSSSI